MIPCHSSGSSRLGELHRPLHVGEEHRHLLALALERASRGEDLLGEVLRGVGARLGGGGALGGIGQRLAAAVQNFCDRGLSRPHEAQVTGFARDAPHSPQNSASCGFSWLQDGQRMLSPSLRQLVEQRLRVLQIGGVEPFGEPAVDLGEHLPRLVALSLRPEQAAEARHGTKLEGLGTLLARQLDRLPKAVFRCVAGRIGRGRERELTSHPMELCLPPGFLVLFRCRKGLVERRDGLFQPSGLSQRIRKQAYEEG